MRVIAVVSQKGGSGKTTLSGHIAVEAQRANGGPVAVMDTDPQGSLSAWWNERDAQMPLFVKTTLPEMQSHLVELEKAGVKLVVIDTPPAITTSICDVIKRADFAVVPTRPSPHDLRAVGATVTLIQRHQKPMVFVVNDASPRARITSDTAIALSQHGTVAPVTVHHRTDFATSMIDGRTVMEANTEGKSSIEIQELWKYLETRLNSDVARTDFHMDLGASDKKMPSSRAINEEFDALVAEQRGEPVATVNPDADVDAGAAAAAIVAAAQAQAAAQAAAQGEETVLAHAHVRPVHEKPLAQPPHEQILELTSDPAPARAQLSALEGGRGPKEDAPLAPAAPRTSRVFGRRHMG